MLQALLNTIPVNDYNIKRPHSLPTPSFTDGQSCATWTLASNLLSVAENKTLSFCPGSVLNAVVDPYLIGEMLPNSLRCQTIFVSIAIPRVFHMALQSGSDTGKEYGLYTFPRYILRELEAFETATWWDSFRLTPSGDSTCSAEGTLPKNFYIRSGAQKDSV